MLNAYYLWGVAQRRTVFVRSKNYDILLLFCYLIKCLAGALLYYVNFTISSFVKAYLL